MVGHIGINKHLQRQVFRQLSPTPCPPGHMVGGRDANGDWIFVPWRKPTRDSAPPKPRTITRDALERIVPIMADIGARIDRLEQKRAAQRQLADQLALQPRPAQVQFEQPTHQPTQDHAPCMCQHVLTPQRTKDGVNTMQRNPQLAPRGHLTFDAPSHRTRDQQQFGEKPPSRFSSQEADRMANYLPPGSAGRTTTKEATNDFNLRALSQRDAQHQYNISGQPQPAMTQGSDLSSAFASELSKVPPGQPATAQNILNRHYNAAKTSDARDGIERVWRDFMSHYDARGDNPFAPRQPVARDAGAQQTVYGTGYVPGTSLAEGNTTKPGGGGGIHPIASSGGSDPGSNAFNTGPRAMGPVGSYGGAGDLKSSEGAPAGAPGAHLAADVPVPPTRPSSLGSSSGGANVESRGQGEWAAPAAGTGGAYATPSHSQSMPNWAGGSSAPTPPTRPSGLGGQAEAAESSSSSGRDPDLYGVASGASKSLSEIEPGAHASQNVQKMLSEDAKKPRGRK